MPDASPAKWHLAHTTWFFETVILQAHAPESGRYDPAYAYLFNSYYNSLGEQHARHRRGLLTRPSLDQVLDYRQHTDEAMLRLLAQAGDNPEVRRLTEIGLQHEQQHQELLQTDIKHALWSNPLRPAYLPGQLSPAAEATRGWQAFAAGPYDIGHAGDGFAYDNEGPRHRVWLHDFEISTRLVSNAEYLEFISDGGYSEPAHWLSDGWDWVQAHDLKAPLYWSCQGGQWQEFTLFGMQALQPHAPACHLSLYEADAYARWSGARLPSEAEWEIAARRAPESAAPRLHPDGQGWLDQVWQWTASAYAPYPGYRAPAGALAEYNAKFMCNQLVLRGGSCFTPAGHARITYRNFFYPPSRWQMSGLRLARHC